MKSGKYNVKAQGHGASFMPMEVTVPKFRKTGEYLITAEYAGNVSEEFKTAVRHGIYQEYTSKEIYIMFSCNEFSYD